MSKRVIRVLSIEGNADWVDEILAVAKVQPGRVLYTRRGTIKEIQRLELRDFERLLAPLKAEPKS